MGVSKNNGTPKSSQFNRVFHYFHHPFWGFSPIFGLTPIYKSTLHEFPKNHRPTVLRTNLHHLKVPHVEFQRDAKARLSEMRVQLLEMGLNKVQLSCQVVVSKYFSGVFFHSIYFWIFYPKPWGKDSQFTGEKTTK